MEVRPEGAEAILIVDDDELVRLSAATLISSLGYRVCSPPAAVPRRRALAWSGCFALVVTAAAQVKLL
ncbi:MAG TPA: response regulator [Xanthobacteraceae bacterium]|nr:response regulator [Xanthobacteraceae bacterium]